MDQRGTAQTPHHIITPSNLPNNPKQNPIPFTQLHQLSHDPPLTKLQGNSTQWQLISEGVSEEFDLESARDANITEDLVALIYRNQTLPTIDHLHSLPDGARVYAFARAINNVGMVSEWYVSDGVTIGNLEITINPDEDNNMFLSATDTDAGTDDQNDPSRTKTFATVQIPAGAVEEDVTFVSQPLPEETVNALNPPSNLKVIIFILLRHRHPSPRSSP